ncbi:uncharacterized protein LOC144423754 [Styela clava]
MTEYLRTGMLNRRSQHLLANFEIKKKISWYVPKANIFNCDETNLQDNPGKRLIVPLGTNRVERIQEHSKTSISLMFCGSAAGVLLSPMVVYAAMNVYTYWTSDGPPPDTIYNAILSGRFDRTFIRWFKELLVPHCQQLQKKKFLNNLISHLSMDIIEMADRHNNTAPTSCNHWIVRFFLHFFKSTFGEFCLNGKRKQVSGDSQMSISFIPEIVLKNLPHNQTDYISVPVFDEEGSEPGITTSCFIKYLSQMHKETASPVRRGRGPKITPGRNLCLLDQKI